MLPPLDGVGYYDTTTSDRWGTMIVPPGVLRYYPHSGGGYYDSTPPQWGGSKKGTGVLRAKGVLRRPKQGS
jgi:hypothetical protein